MTTTSPKLGGPNLEDRRLLRARLLANPNYFGTIADSPLEPVTELSGDINWEQLVCLGYNPTLGQLEAVVSIKQPTGYSGGLCSSGSTEYVRFFVDFGAGLTNVGLTSIQVHDIPDPPSGSAHPIEYLVSLPLDASAFEQCCSSPVLPNVRAEVSWNVVPSTSPSVLPVFGNQLDAVIQLPPSIFKCWEGVLAAPPPELGFLAKAGIGAAQLAQVKPAWPPDPVPWSTLRESYERAQVPPHRLVYPAIYPMISADPGIAAAAAAAGSQADLTETAKLGIDLSAVVGELSEGGGNTDYEQLTCVGLNTPTDTFGAVVQVKQPAGYSGDLCSTGSQEYVAFWADWDADGVFEAYLGTASVGVHDISTIPAGGLYYSVLLPVTLGEYLQACSTPNVVNIRAVLSWAVPPSTVDPDAVPYWGNILDALVQIRPGEASGIYELLYDVGGVPIPDISTVTFLANPSGGVLNPADCSQPATDRPFGGVTRVGGRIYNSGPPGTVYFQVQYAPHGGSLWLPVTHQTTFQLMHPNPADPLYPEQDVTITSADGWFPYQENWTVNPPILERTALLAWWDTTALPDGAYDIRLAYTTDYPVLAVISYSPAVTIILDNTQFVVSPTANAVVDPTSTLDLVIDGGDCHSYAQGDQITGHLRALHDQFWFWTLDLEPSTHTHGTEPVPECRSFGSLTDTGDADAPWSLDTTNLDTCGYTLTVWAWDRTIVDSNGAIEHTASKAVGFAVT
jgi:hypothetical protein